jgi:hypothetical protein
MSAPAVSSQIRRLESCTGARSDGHEFLDDVANSVEGQANPLESIEMTYYGLST